MNIFIEEILQDLRKAANEFRRDTTRTLLEYRQRLQKAQQEAHAFKDEFGYVRKQKDSAARQAREAITVARNAFQGHARPLINQLRDELGTSLMHNSPDAKFYPTLNIFRDYGICPEEADIHTLVELSHGSYLATRALNTVLVATECPYRVETLTSGEVEKDLSRLEAFLAPSVLPPVDADLHSELAEVFVGEPMTTITDKNGNPVDIGERFDITNLVLTTAAFNSNFDELDGIGKKWISGAIPGICRYDPEKDDAAEAVAKFEQSQAETARSAVSVKKKADGGVALATQLAKEGQTDPTVISRYKV